ncbi:MAG: hypothetical protein JNJ56_10255 [Ignavibacteria bacterium]|nr:hypothetical protein [Ignavibacteria bacterium]
MNKLIFLSSVLLLSAAGCGKSDLELEKERLRKEAAELKSRLDSTSAFIESEKKEVDSLMNKITKESKAIDSLKMKIDKLK